MNSGINVWDKKQMFLLEAGDIVRLEAKGICTHIYSAAHSSKFTLSRHLKLVLEQLACDQLVKVHRSHAVNLRHIACYEKGRGGILVMKDGSRVPVAQREKAKVLARLMGKRPAH